MLPKPTTDEIKDYYKRSYTEKHYKTIVEIGHTVKNLKFEWFIRQIENSTEIHKWDNISLLDIGSKIVYS